MDINQFKSLLSEEKYQVFLFSCPACFPFSFARHTWFVVYRDGDISRWEIFWRPQKWEKRWGHLHKDFYEPTQGIARSMFSEKNLWRKVRVLGKVEGGEGSLAKKILDLIESSPKNYPFNNRYSLLGPNSNTYPQWIINHFPSSGLKLSWNSLGKNRIPEIRFGKC
jgi:hypothetical protein